MASIIAGVVGSFGSAGTPDSPGPGIDSEPSGRGRFVHGLAGIVASSVALAYFGVLLFANLMTLMAPQFRCDAGCAYREGDWTSFPGSWQRDALWVLWVLSTLSFVVVAFLALVVRPTRKRLIWGLLGLGINRAAGYGPRTPEGWQRT